MTAVRFTAERKVKSIKRSSANTHRVKAKRLESNSQKETRVPGDALFRLLLIVHLVMHHSRRRQGAPVPAEEGYGVLAQRVQTLLYVAVCHLQVGRVPEHIVEM